MEHMLADLMELQEIDSRLLKLEKMKGSLPEEVLDLRAQESKQAEQLKATETALQTAGQNKRRYELELKSLEDKIAKYKQQIYAVKTNKEYDAITAEIETTEIEMSDLETQVLEILELEEKLQPQIEAEKKALEAISNLIVHKEAELTRLMQSTESEEQVLQKQRETVVPRISKPILANYERVRKAKYGIAVVPIENGICTGCFSNLPPQTAMEIKKMNQLINCLTCGRYLIYRENGEAKAPSDA